MDRKMVVVEPELAAYRGKVGLAQRRPDCVLVFDFAVYRRYCGIDESD
jgi:hypothetical protein